MVTRSQADSRERHVISVVIDIITVLSINLK